MSILDKLIGRREKEKLADKKPEAVQVEKKVKVEEKKVPAKVEKAKDKPVKKTKTEKPKKEITKRKIAKKDNNIAHKVLLENLISEKSTMLVAENKYVFKVHPKAGKFQIKEAVEGYYGVQVVSVNTIKINPKKRIQGRTIGWKKGFKKAIVTLRQGDTIGAAEGV